jgi:hypothetical protein
MTISKPKRILHDSQPTTPAYILNQILNAGRSWDYEQFCEELGLFPDIWAIEKFQALQSICNKMLVIYPEMLELVYYASQGDLVDE